jgi:uncharacterized repeat protein (TIGR01451 family)
MPAFLLFVVPKKRSSIIIKRAFFLIIVLAAGLSVFTAVAFIIPSVFAQNNPSTRYLAPGGADNGNDCANPAVPCATLRHALNVAQPDNTILVAGGTYSHITSSGGVTQVAIISQPVTIRGGYTAVFTDPPDPQANPTIFNANGQGRVFTILDAGLVTLNGLQLTGGSASGANDRGGALYVLNSQLTLQNSAVYGSQAGYGGGLYLQNSQVNLWQNEIYSNSARFSGGGIRCYGCAGSLQHNQILSNTAVLNGGGLQITASPLTLANNLIQNNGTATAGLGWGGGVHLQASADTLLTGNTIQNNRAYAGGGLRLYNSSAVLQGNLIRDNEAEQGGGLLLENNSHALLENNAFIANSAAVQGAGLSVLSSAPLLRHNTFNGNVGTAVYAANSQFEMSNSLIANHDTGVVNTGGTVTLTTTLWDNNSADTQGSVQQSNAFTGSAGFAADGYHITAVSAALNAADPSETTIDIDNQQRPHYGGSDIGADEWWPLDAVKLVSAVTVQPGLVVTYTIVLTNHADTTAAFMVTDTLPAQVDFIGPTSASVGSASFSGGAVLWQGSLSPNSSAALLWPVQVANNLLPGATITNSAIVQDEQGVYNTTTAVMVVPAKVYLPIIVR